MLAEGASGVATGMQASTPLVIGAMIQQSGPAYNNFDMCVTISSSSVFGLMMVFHGPNEERRAGGASPLWQAGFAAWVQIGTCLPWEKGTNPRAAGQRQSKSS